MCTFMASTHQVTIMGTWGWTWSVDKPFVYTHRTHVAGTVDKLVHTKRILVRFYVVAGTDCKSSVHDATLKLEFNLSLLHDVRIQTSWIHATSCGDKIRFRSRNFSQRNGHVARGKLSLQCVQASCPLVCADPGVPTYISTCNCKSLLAVKTTKVLTYC